MQMLRWLPAFLPELVALATNTFSNLNGEKIQSLDATQTPYGIACTDDLKVNKRIYDCAENDI
jgi:hypothetical protein